jgi:hypothetical protein
MARDEAAALVRRYLAEAWGQGNEEAVYELVAPDYVDHYPPPGTTPDRIRPIPPSSCARVLWARGRRGRGRMIVDDREGHAVPGTAWPSLIVLG